MEDDLKDLSREELMAEVERLRAGIRKHRDSSGHALCWYHPALWNLLPEKTAPQIAVPNWAQFLSGCVQYRQSLDIQAPDAPRIEQEYEGAMQVDPAISGRPLPGEYAAYAQADIDLAVGDDACELLGRLQEKTVALFSRFGDPGGDLVYGAGKWTVKEVLGHLADDERIFAYRALCLARGDDRELPGFDEKQYVAGARFTDLPMAELLADYLAVRRASIALFRNLDTEAWTRRGIVNGYAATPRGLAFHIAGHELHHHRVLSERYLPLARGKSWWPLS